MKRPITIRSRLMPKAYGVFIRADAAHLKHLGVNHAAAEDLDSALAPCRAGQPSPWQRGSTDIHLRRRLGEREVMRTGNEQPCPPYSFFANSSRMPFRSLMRMPLSTTRPRSGWNSGEWLCQCVRTVTRPGAIMRIGGLCAFPSCGPASRGLCVEHNVIRNIEGILRVACRMIL